MASTKKTHNKTKKQSQLTLQVVDVSGKATESIGLPDSIFDVSASDKLISQYVRVFLTNRRQGTSKSKTRGEVHASTRKIYRQKGTGRARHGARSAPIFVGGGTAHGSKLQSFDLKMNKKQKQKALYYALTMKLRDAKIHAVEGIESLNGKTREMTGVLEGLKADPSRILVIYAPGQAERMRKMLGNISGTMAANDRQLNAYDVVRARTLLFTKEGLLDFIDFRNTDKK